MTVNGIAYIPLRYKTIRVGSSRWLKPPTPTLKFALPPTRNPNASQWNIDCVGSPGIGAQVGHVYMLFVSISFALGSQRKRNFQWNMGLWEKIKMMQEQGKEGFAYKAGS